MNDQEMLEEYQEIMQEIKDRVERAMYIVRQLQPEEYSRAKAYWYGHIVCNIDDDHVFLGRHDCTMRDTYEVMLNSMSKENNNE